MSLQLVELGHTDVAMFLANGEVVQPSEVLHNRPVLIERGSFRPVTNVTLNMLDAALAQLREEPDRRSEEPSVLMEMTLNNLLSGPTIDHQDFLARAAILGALDKTVMISNYTRFDRVTTYLRQYTQNWISMVVGHSDAARNLRRKVLRGVAGRNPRGPRPALPGIGQTVRLSHALRRNRRTRDGRQNRDQPEADNTCTLTCSRTALSSPSSSSPPSSSISIPATS